MEAPGKLWELGLKVDLKWKFNQGTATTHIALCSSLPCQLPISNYRVGQEAFITGYWDDFCVWHVMCPFSVLGCWLFFGGWNRFFLGSLMNSFFFSTASEKVCIMPFQIFVGKDRQSSGPLAMPSVLPQCQTSLESCMWWLNDMYKQRALILHLISTYDLEESF